MNDRIRSIQEKIEDLRKRWPAHSAPPAMLQELDDLEEALEIEIEAIKKSKDAG